jgi:hypothetical protein
MGALGRDLSFAIRVLRTSRGSTLVALLALALGIGANTAIFSVVNAVLLRPMPFRDPDRLAMVWEHSPRTGKANPGNPQNFGDWQARNRSFEKMAAYVPFQLTMSVTGDGVPEEVPANLATRDFFSILGVQPALGRDFLAEDDVPGQNNVTLISDGFWRRRFGADPRVIGRRLIVQGAPVTVVGVLPQGFRFPEIKADIWRLYRIDRSSERHGRSMAAIARLKPGVTLTQAQDDMTGIAAQLAEEFPSFNGRWGATVIPMREQFTGCSARSA